MEGDERRARGPLASAIVGEDAWTSDWLAVTQSMVDAFAAATLDSDPMHDDPVWAARNSPLGTTIAYGFQTMSLLSHLMKGALGGGDLVTSSEAGSSLNYGFDRLRLVSPVPVGSRIRGVFKLKDRVVDEKGRTVTTILATVEVEGHDRPALAAEWLSVWVPAKCP